MDNTIIATCNLKTNTWEPSILGELNDGSLDLKIKFSGLNSVEFENFKVGYNFYVDNVLVSEEEYPKNRMSLLRILETYTINPFLTLQVSKSHRLHLWAEINDNKIEKNINIDNVMVKQPHPSWTLVNGNWTPPVPKPTEQSIWSWNEEKLTWISLDHEYMADAAGSRTGPPGNDN